ncbi:MULTISPECIES: ABC transporter permease [Brucella/Ochrobactrum group]|jgi:peptide/nickel transport system permease protein|uniref:Binding-protein-dependent transport systems inner membrane component n=2 Tax=Brucella anthropi TaxID=529 RepID=A6X2N7_BRUA4|nr:MULTISPECIES: ABC transporter permease [Brucella/Ochrobactrum group]QTN05801.1 ABC transporter permease subunit [Ochrobactrum sp. EEELCW01]ABS15491.1 binding-protein-dependent transport systems inner membrane component [Brucella anthropi ATCC 49188]AIK41416.1 binding--dependent transport system inner membrane component family protein [Brucella anthropi]EXL03089.1 ABC transporter permease [Brucella anthropi]KAB2729913.1 ABC transporter permease [Brucella anthropi]
MFVLILKRVGLGLLTLFLVSALIFAGTQILPGDVASAILGQNATPEALATLRESLGLNQPVLARYFAWLAGFVTGDLGTSLANQQPVADLLWPRFWNTMALAAFAAVVSVPIAILLGLVTAVKRGGIFDRVINIVALAFVSLPEYFLGLLLILFLSIRFNLLPSLADTYEGMTFLEWIQATALPALTLVLVTVAQMMRMTRTAVLSVMDQAYVETAYLKGLRTKRVVTKHALPNAAAPIVNVVAFNIAYLITGVVLVEAVFNYNGLGRFMVDAVSKRDLPLVQAAALVFGAAYVILNIIADVAAIALNPRLRHPR